MWIFAQTIKSIVNIKRLILLAVAFVFMAMVGTSVYLIVNYERIFIDPTIPAKPVVYTQSISPNGKYTCVVNQNPPTETSTYNYQFTIRDNATSAELKGKTFTLVTDSVPAGKLEFDWLDDELNVSNLNYHPRYTFATVKIANGEQTWTDLTKRQAR